MFVLSTVGNDIVPAMVVGASLHILQVLARIVVTSPQWFFKRQPTDHFTAFNTPRIVHRVVSRVSGVVQPSVCLLLMVSLCW